MATTTTTPSTSGAVAPSPTLPLQEAAAAREVSPEPPLSRKRQQQPERTRRKETMTTGRGANRRVTFDARPPAYSPDPEPPLTAHEIRDAWMSDEEHARNLSNARRDVRRLILQMREEKTADGDGIDDDAAAAAEEEERDNLRWYRGLEYKASPDRWRRREVVIGAILTVQERLRQGLRRRLDEERPDAPPEAPSEAAAAAEASARLEAAAWERAAEALAAVAGRLSVPASELAREIGLADFAEAMWDDPVRPALGDQPTAGRRGAALGKRKRARERSFAAAAASEENGKEPEGGRERGRNVRLRVVAEVAMAAS